MAQQREKKHAAKSRIIGMVAILSVLVILIAVVLIGVFTEWFGLGGPLTAIMLAADRTLDTENLHMEAQVQSDTMQVTVSADLELNLENRHLAACGTIRWQETQQTFAIWQQQLILRLPDGRVRTVDIHETLDALFDSKYGITPDGLLTELTREVTDALGIRRQVSIKTAKGLLLRAIPGMNRTPWLREYVGLQVQETGMLTRYDFTVQTSVLKTVLLDTLKASFRDSAAYEAAVKRGHDEPSQLLVASVLVQHGKLTGVHFQTGTDADDLCVTLELSRLGAVKVDAAQLLPQ